MLPKPGHAKEHLWMIVAAPDRSGDALMLNITSRRPGSDTTTILAAGEHPFLTHESVVYYADARAVNVQSLQAGFAHGVVRPMPAASAALLARVQAGITTSPFTPRKVKQAYSDARAQGRT